jgi:hypothetical protein
VRPLLAVGLVIAGFNLLVLSAAAALTPGLVSDINPGTGSSVPSVLTNVNGTLFFSADDGSSGRELWRSDGDRRGYGTRQ